MQTLQVTVTIQQAPFHDYVGGGTGHRLPDSALAPASTLRASGPSPTNWRSHWPGRAGGRPRARRRRSHRHRPRIHPGGRPVPAERNWKPAAEANCLRTSPSPLASWRRSSSCTPSSLAAPARQHPPRPRSRRQPTPRPKATALPPAEESWQVRTLLAGPGEPGRLYALLTEVSSGAWPAERVAFLISDDYGRTWTPFPGGLPAGGCVLNVNLDYATPDALYASTCRGLYRWTGAAWKLLSPLETGMVAVVYGDPRIVWATDVFGEDGVVVRSNDGGASWTPASYGLIHFNGVANIGIDPRDANTLYAVIWPKYAGSYLRRGTAAGQWQVMPTPLDQLADRHRHHHRRRHRHAVRHRLCLELAAVAHAEPPRAGRERRPVGTGPRLWSRRRLGRPVGLRLEPRGPGPLCQPVALAGEGHRQHGRPRAPPLAGRRADLEPHASPLSRPHGRS